MKRRLFLCVDFRSLLELQGSFPAAIPRIELSTMLSVE